MLYQRHRGRHVAGCVRLGQSVLIFLLQHHFYLHQQGLQRRFQRTEQAVVAGAFERMGQTGDLARAYHAGGSLECVGDARCHHLIAGRMGGAASAGAS
jgi:hypothetical protein